MGKHLSIDERAVMFAEYMLEHSCTVRAVAARFGFSKSTVHKDLSVRLYDFDRELYDKVAVLLGENKEQRHIRGGNATKKKYSELKQGCKKTYISG